MSKIAIITDSNSGITQNEAKELGIIVVAMPFTIDGEEFLEDITLSQEQFYEKMLSGGQVKTSQPSPETIMELWNKTLEEYDEIVHIPMSSGLSGACQTALMLSEDYDGKVAVVDNQRISVTQKSSVFDAMKLAKKGLSAAEIRDKLMEDKFESSIYIMMDTLSYLKTGGRLTGAVAALGTLLKIKPVLQIQGEKLDAFSVARTHNQAKNIMMNQIAKDFTNRFKVPEDGEGMQVFVAYTYNKDAADLFFEEVKERFPKAKAEYMDALSLSVSCHIGPGALAIACARDSFAE